MEEIILFGAANSGRAFAAAINNVFEKVIAFTDNNEELHGEQIDGIPVVSVAEAIKLDKKIIITSGYWENISKQLEDFGVTNYVLNPYTYFANLRKLGVTNADAVYWEYRYISGGNSGAGSYGKASEYKAEVINGFISEMEIDTAIELGCGDGNHLAQLNIKNYLGFDISETALILCHSRNNKRGFSFVKYIPQLVGNIGAMASADLCLSVDVIYHLTDNWIYEKYMRDLINMSRKYVLVYTTLTDRDHLEFTHETNRDVIKWMEENAPNFELIRHIPSPLPEETDYKDFIIYKRIV